jgi:hypothetical protein
MVEATLPRPSRFFPSKRVAAALLVAFLIALNWSAVRDEIAKNRCDTVLGKLSTRLKLDFYFSHCQCMTHSLDFSDPCNSMYVSIIL